MNQGENHTLFLDRDGVINVQLVGDYVKKLSELKIREDFLRSAPLLQRYFRRMIIVTNQQGIAKRICTIEEVEAVHRHLLHILKQHEIYIDKIYFCPHLNGAGCQCRKPEIGMALQARKDFPEIDFADSVMIGDSYTDMQFGKRCGMQTVFIGTLFDDHRNEIVAHSDIIVPNIFDYAKQLS